MVNNNMMGLYGVTRIECIRRDSWRGRVFSRWNVEDVELHFQDNGKTLKIIYEEKPEEEEGDD